MKSSLLRLSALGVLLLAGCGSDSTIKFSQLDDAYANAICDMLANCPQTGGFGSQLERLLAQNPGLTTCQDQVLQSGDVNLGVYQASIDAGRIKYDGAAAKSCLDTVSRACVSPDSRQASAVSPACDDIFQGQVALGGLCTLDEDCAGAARCEQANNSCSGTCVALVPLGGNCGGSSDCDQNVPHGYAVCEPTTANPNDHCVAVTVTDNVAGGGACGMVVSTGENWEYAYCNTSLFCRRSSGGGNFAVGVCAAPLALGATCQPGLDVCVDGAVCAQNTGGAQGSSCRAVTVVSTVGALCSNDALTLCNPLDRLDCNNNACVLVGTGVAGQPCRRDWPADCDTGLYCQEAGGGQYDGFCAAKLVDGTACNPNFPDSCVSGYCDDRTNPIAPVCAPVMCQ